MDCSKLTRSGYSRIVLFLLLFLLLVCTSTVPPILLIVWRTTVSPTANVSNSRILISTSEADDIFSTTAYNHGNPPSAPSPSPAPGSSQRHIVRSPVLPKKSLDNAKTKLPAITWAIVGVFFLLLLVSFRCFLFIRRSRSTTNRPSEETAIVTEAEEESLMSNNDLKMFTIEELKTATHNFNDALKLGQGGFGAVYKGILPDGKAVAVKKLSAQSFAGEKEAMNEIQLLAHVQHRNLVNIVGCCSDSPEKILVFEYFSNGSLEKHVFERRKHLDWHARRKHLNWHARYNILVGIAKGLVYLHEDSKLRIIHRDIKASNILLDDNFNPKITDFGIAKLFSEVETEIRTRVAGTYGYMAPEYAMEGRLSRKADVYSYGILLLEIISGRRNTATCGSQEQGLLGLTWMLYQRGDLLELVDEAIKPGCPDEQLRRCIQIGLLCIEKEFALRPPMSTVLLMLLTDSVTVPSPKAPAFLASSTAYHPHSNSTYK